MELKAQEPHPYGDKPLNGAHVMRGPSTRNVDVTKTPNKKTTKSGNKGDRATSNEESISPVKQQQEQTQTNQNLAAAEHQSSTQNFNAMGFGGTGGGGVSTSIMKHNSFIFQKYIERPLLIYGRKFDIRCWVLWNYDGRIYLFKEGYLRTSSRQYKINPDNPDDMFTHLTNNAVQKTSKDYGAFEDGN